MKLSTIGISLLTLVVIAGCTTEHITPQGQIERPKVLDGLATLDDHYLVFETYQDWEEAISLANKPKNEGWVKELHKTNFTSLYDVKVDKAKREAAFQKMGHGWVSYEPDMNAYIMSLVSPQGLIQIGDYLIRVNWQDEAAYAILASSAERSLASLIAEDLHDPAVMFFASEDNILELLKAGASKGAIERTEWCRAERVKSDADRYGQEFGLGLLDQWWYDVEHKYVNGLIYFELTTKSNYSMFDSGTIEWNPPIEQQLTFSFDWTACNGSTGRGADTFIYFANKTDNDWYRGSSKLSNYDLSSTFRYRSHLEGSPLYIARLEDI